MNVIEFAAELLRLPSLSGQERKVAQAISEKMHRLGYDRVWFDQNGSVIGEIVGGLPGPTLLFDGHMDTVPVDNPREWSLDPFGGEINNGKLYGRGASDMKGALAAMVCGAAQLIPRKADWGGRILVAGVVMEEIFEGVCLGDIIDEVHPDFVIIGEASELRLNIGQRGRAEISLETFGKSCHSSNPEKGVNAIYHLAPLIETIKTMAYPEHPRLGSGITVITDIISQPYPGASVLPHHCLATLDRRLLIGETPGSVLELLRTTLEMNNPEIPFKVDIVQGSLKTYTGRKLTARRFFPGWLYGEEEDFVRKILAGLHSAGFNTSTGTYSFCTDGSCSAGERGIPTLGFGPGKESLAHVTNEYIETLELEQAVEGYTAIASSLLGANGGN